VALRLSAIGPLEDDNSVRKSPFCVVNFLKV
jgi:hypothetical protein